MSEIKHKYFASIATKYSLRIIIFTTCFGQRGPSSGLVWCSLEDGPRWPKHVVNVIIRKEYLVAKEAKYLCFIPVDILANTSHSISMLAPLSMTIQTFHKSAHIATSTLRN
jgi:hypothetical protein